MKLSTLFLAFLVAALLNMMSSVHGQLLKSCQGTFSEFVAICDDNQTASELCDTTGTLASNDERVTSFNGKDTRTLSMTCSSADGNLCTYNCCSSTCAFQTKVYYDDEDYSGAWSHHHQFGRQTKTVFLALSVIVTFMFMM